MNNSVIQMNFIKSKYGKFFEKWNNKYDDDRMVFCNIYETLLEAYEELNDHDINNSTIGVAMNQKLNDEVKILDEIIDYFEYGRGR